MDENIRLTGKVSQIKIDIEGYCGRIFPLQKVQGLPSFFDQRRYHAEFKIEKYAGTYTPRLERQP